MPDIQVVLAWLGGLLTATLIAKNGYDFVLSLLGRKRSVKKEDLDIAQKFEELTKNALEARQAFEDKFNTEHELVLSINAELQEVKNAAAFRMSMIVYPYVPAIGELVIDPIVPGTNVSVLVTSGDGTQITPASRKINTRPLPRVKP